jgi:hypothetical protein
MYHSGPEYEAPDDIRCEALVKGHPSYVYEWQRRDHRCPRRANQMRGPRQVCFQHARMREVEYVEPGSKP